MHNPEATDAVPDPQHAITIDIFAPSISTKNPFITTETPYTIFPTVRIIPYYEDVTSKCFHIAEVFAMDTE